MSKWAAMAAQTKKAGVAVTPEPLPKAKAESLAHAVYDTPPTTYKIPIYSGLRSNQVSRYAEGTALAVLQALSKMLPLPPVPGDDAKASKTKAQAPMFGIGVIRDDLPQGHSMAGGTAFKAVQAVAFDVDDATPEQIDLFDAALQAKGWLYLKTTTFKHTPENPRYRYVLLLSRHAEGGDFYTTYLWGGLQVLAGGIGDPRANDAPRRSYFPSCPKGQEGNRPAPIIKGERAVDPDELAALVAPEGGMAAHTQSRYDSNIYEDVLGTTGRRDKRDRDPGVIASGCSFFNEFVRTGDPDRGHGDGLWRLAGGVCNYVSEGETLFLSASAKDIRFDLREARRKFESWGSFPPPKCASIRASGWEACTGCPQRGRITSPVELDDSLEAPLSGDQKPDALGKLRASVADGTLQIVVDADGRVNYVKSYVRDGRNSRDVYRAGTENATDLLTAMVMRDGGKIPTQQQVLAFEAMARIEAKEAGRVIPVALRVADVGGVLYHDLGPGRIVAVTVDGYRVTEESEDTPLFRRGAGAGELPDPDFTGGPDAALRYLVKAYGELFNLDSHRALVAVVLLLDALNPGTAHPVREYVGPGGSGKSTVAEHDVNLIDPGDSGRRTTGAKADDLAASAQQQYCVMVDNAGRMDKTTQDTFSVMSTGGTLMMRQFHKQAEVIPLNLHRVLSITAVQPQCTQPDLMTRVVRFELQPLPADSYVNEQEMRESMNAIRPRMLGAMYTLLAGALRVLPKVRERKEWPHRMVSFDQLGEACVLAAGLKPGTFLRVIGDMRGRMARRTASGDLFTLKLLEALQKFTSQPLDETQLSLSAVLKRPTPVSVVAHGENRVEITARPGALRSAMPHPSNFDRDNAMPGTDRAFLDALRRVQPMLTSLGVVYSEIYYGTRPFVRFDASREALSGD